VKALSGKETGVANRVCGRAKTCGIFNERVMVKMMVKERDAGHPGLSLLLNLPLSLSLTHSFILSLSHSLILSISHSLTFSLSLSISLSLSHSLTLSRSRSHSLTLSLSHALALTLSLSHSHCLTLGRVSWPTCSPRASPARSGPPPLFVITREPRIE